MFALEIHNSPKGVNVSVIILCSIRGWILLLSYLEKEVISHRDVRKLELPKVFSRPASLILGKALINCQQALRVLAIWIWWTPSNLSVLGHHDWLRYSVSNLRRGTQQTRPGMGVLIKEAILDYRVVRINSCGNWISRNRLLFTSQDAICIVTLKAWPMDAIGFSLLKKQYPSKKRTYKPSKHAILMHQLSSRVELTGRF